MALFFSISAFAQDAGSGTYSFEFRGESLGQVLDQIVRETGTDLIYDPELVRGAEVYKRITDQPVPGILRMVLADHNLDFLTLSSGTIVIVRMVSEEPAYGTFTGKVVDGRTGEPLPGATIMLADASGGTSAGRTGNFSMSRLMSGEHTITFSFIGYKPVTKTIRIPPNGRINETIQLAQGAVSVTPIVVESHRPQLFGGYGGQHRTGSDDAVSAGEIRRPIRDLSLVPGVQHGLPMRGIHLQGGQRSEHRLLLDGVPVYNPFSIGNMFSSFSPHAIGAVTLHRAGFGASHGSQISGAINLKHELPAEGHNGATLQADPLSINARGDLSFRLDEESSLSIMTAFRTSYWDTYRDPNLERSLKDWDRIDPLITNQAAGLESDASFYTPMDHLSELDFYDLHAASRLRINSFNEISASFYSSENNLQTALLNRALPGVETVPYLFAAESYSWKNRTGQVSWNSLLTPRIDLNTGISYSFGSFSHGSEIGTSMFSVFPGTFTTIVADRVEFDFESAIELPSTIEGNRIYHFTAASDLRYSLSSSFEIDAGLQFERITTGLDVEEGTYLPTFASVRSSMLSSHLSGSYRFGSYWHLNAGSRLTYLIENSTVYAEPRASIQYDRPESSIGYWSAKLSGGLYRQFINEFSITNTGASAVVPSFSVWSHAGTTNIAKAYHLSGSWYASFSANSTLRLESFYKWQPVTNITSYRNLIDGRDLDRSEVSAFAESTEMTAIGGSIRAEHAFSDGKYSLMAGYDYSYTRLNLDSQFGKTVPAPWSEPHRAQLRAMWHIANDVTISGKWQGIWGRMWAFRESYYNLLQVADLQVNSQFQFNSPENDRLRPFNQADLSLIYRPTAAGTDLEFRVDFINIFNRKNPLDKWLTPVINDGEIVEYKTAERTMPGFYPSVSVQATF